VCPGLEINKDKTEKEKSGKKETKNNHQGKPENRTASKNTQMRQIGCCMVC
jgi:hypothetical protein